jgi:hypothetical protein
VIHLPNKIIETLLKGKKKEIYRDEKRGNI